MKAPVLAGLLLGIAAATPGLGAVDLARALQPASICYYYTSIDITTVSIGASPTAATVTVAASGASQTPPAPPGPLSSALVTTPPQPTDRSIILSIVPLAANGKRDDSTQALGGFVNTEELTPNPSSCSNATVMALSSSGELYVDGLAVFSEDNNYVIFRSLGNPPQDAITTTFTDVGGYLVWQNQSFLDGEAQFCQVSSSGQTYITFSEEAEWPSNCSPVSLQVYDGEKRLYYINTSLRRLITMFLSRAMSEWTNRGVHNHQTLVSNWKQVNYVCTSV